MEDAYPGIWQNWFKLGCVTDGHPPEQGFHTDREDEVTDDTKRDKGWPRIRIALNAIKPGDKIVAKLPGNQIGRIGEVLRNDSAKWKPLYPADRTDPHYKDWTEGYMGRRILVRWDMGHGPHRPDMVVQLPKGFSLGQGELHRVRCKTVKDFEKEMDNQANWVGLFGGFAYESALSDFIAQYPHKLKDGLEPNPIERIREVILKGRKRLDVLLRDEVGPVIVECKQGYPTVKDVGQLRGYIKDLKEKIGERARGILVHGGAGRVNSDVLRKAKEKPRIDLIRYKLDVDFTPSR
jgi:hypothetical protein